jgi:GntR family transcriptional repressor for pyruvate dehydrogenase complex
MEWEDLERQVLIRLGPGAGQSDKSGSDFAEATPDKQDGTSSDARKLWYPEGFMPIQPIEPRRLYLQIADQIRALIAAGEFSPGARLPAERELAKRFGVSRPSLREALIALEVEGHVDVRPGSGILVTAPGSAATASADVEGPLEILRARSLIEGEIAAEAANLITANEIDSLERILLAMQVPAPPRSLLLSDREFHLTIASNLKNKVLLRMVTDLFDQRDSPFARQFALHFDSPETWHAVLEEHRQILATLAARDPEESRKAMRDHLRHAHNRWAGELDRREREVSSEE